MTRAVARVQCLRDFRIAVPQGVLSARRGEVVTTELRVAALLEKAGVARIVEVQWGDA